MEKSWYHGLFCLLALMTHPDVPQSIIILFYPEMPSSMGLSHSGSTVWTAHGPHLNGLRLVEGNYGKLLGT